MIDNIIRPTSGEGLLPPPNNNVMTMTPSIGGQDDVDNDDFDGPDDDDDDDDDDDLDNDDEMLNSTNTAESVTPSTTSFAFSNTSHVASLDRLSLTLEGVSDIPSSAWDGLATTLEEHATSYFAEWYATLAVNTSITIISVEAPPTTTTTMVATGQVQHFLLRRFLSPAASAMIVYSQEFGWIQPNSITTVDVTQLATLPLQDETSREGLVASLQATSTDFATLQRVSEVQVLAQP
jgi:hypothetical protein